MNITPARVIYKLYCIIYKIENILGELVLQKIPEFNTLEEITQWILEEQARLKSTDSNSKKKKEWIPVERKVFVDDFSWLLKDTKEEVNLKN